MIEPTEEDIGRKVLYHDWDGIEEGVITSINGLVFVRYGSETYSKATRREDLTWMDES